MRSKETIYTIHRLTGFARCLAVTALTLAPATSATMDSVYSYDAEIRSFVEDPLIVAIRQAMDRSFGCGYSSNPGFHRIRVHRELRTIPDTKMPGGILAAPMTVKIHCANNTVIQSLTVDFSYTLVDENDNHVPFDPIHIMQIVFEVQDNHTVFPPYRARQAFDEDLAKKEIRGHTFWREFNEIAQSYFSQSCQPVDEHPVFFRRELSGVSALPGNDGGRRFLTGFQCTSLATESTTRGFEFEGSYYEGRNFVLPIRIEAAGTTE